MDVSVLVKGRFEVLEGAVAVAVGSNCWEIEIPVDPQLSKRVRRGESPEDWDGAVFLLGDAESEPAVGSGAGKGTVKVTAFVV